MSAVLKFLSRTQGKNGPALVDWISYIYLLLGFLIIFLPVLWPVSYTHLTLPTTPYV